MTEDQAKRQFFLLTYLRFSGVALAFLGIAITVKRWVEPADLIGGLLIVFGIVNTVVLPPLVLRRMKRDDS